METLTESGAITLGTKSDYVALNSVTPLIAATLASPKQGHLLVIAQTDAGTAGHTVTLTAGSFSTDGDNTLTFNAADECVVLYGVSDSQYIVLHNIGSVALSNV